MTHDIIYRRYTFIPGKRIFASAHLCNGILTFDNNLYVCDNELFVRINAHHSLVYYLAYSNIQTIFNAIFLELGL